MGRITPDSIRNVREANDIVEVIGGMLSLQRAGSAFKALCPFHKENTPSFTVNPQRQSFKCFGCNEGGSVIDFVMKYERMDFREAIERLAERAGVTLEFEDGKGPSPQERKLNRSRKQMMFDAMAWANDGFHQRLLKAKDAQIARDYLKSRNLSKSQVQTWGIGYAPDSYDQLLTGGIKEFGNPKLLDAVGLTRVNDAGKRYDFFRGRLMFPIKDIQGRVVAFGARKLKEDDQGGKYINSPATEVYDKSRVLYAIDRLPGSEFNRGRERGQKLVVVVEGYLDVIACHNAGIDCAVAPCGTAITPDQLNVLARFGNRIVLVMDGDKAGQDAMERIVPEVIAQGLNVTAVMLPDGQDPDDFLKQTSSEKLVEMLERGKDLFEYKLDAVKRRYDIQHAAGARDAVQDAISVLVECKDEVLIDHYLRRMATEFSLSEADAHRRLKQLRKAKPSRNDTEHPTPEIVELPTDERALLLRLLEHPELIRPVGEFFFPEDFTSRVAGEVFRTILNCYDEFGEVDGNLILDQVPPHQSNIRSCISDLVDGDLSVATASEAKAEGSSDESPFDLESTLANIRAWAEKRRLRSASSQAVDPRERLNNLRKKKNVSGGNRRA